MNLIALLCWYDERDDWLDKGIRSLAKAPVDHVIAVDGAYALFPDGEPHSPPSNVQAIEKACEAIGAGCTIHQPDRVWQGNEIEKRTFLFHLADQHAEPHVDWLLVWDGDFQLGKCANLKPRLQHTDLDAADIRLIEPMHPNEKPRMNGLVPEPKRTDIRLMYRAIPGIHCVRNHFTYRTPDGRTLWGNPNTDTLVDGLPLFDVHVLHKTNKRGSRGARAIRYYRDRDSTGAENTTCHFCGTEGHTQGIAYQWEWTRKGQHGWTLSGGLAPACPTCALKHGTKKDKPMVLRCPECEGRASRRSPCAFCDSKGYKLHDPNQLQMNLGPAITGDHRQGQTAIAR